jgi:signal transduction histidine kinase
VGVMMLANAYLIYRNSMIIDSSKDKLDRADEFRINTVDIIASLHLLDLAVRSYVFVRGDHFMTATETALANNKQALTTLEAHLQSQSFPMEDFYALRDSVRSYIQATDTMMMLINAGKEEDFVRMLELDPGYGVWLMHQQFTKKANAFVETIETDAQQAFVQALRNSYMLQILLFVVTIPTLIYTAYFANRTLMMTEKLRQSEVEKGELLLNQNIVLEKTVHERTREVLAQNEEISSQNEEIASHNEQLILQQTEIANQHNNLSKQNEELHAAKRIIEEQNDLIHRRNVDLAEEVARQTQDLKQTNLELIEKNNRLEQFTFIISHNLRAPLARLSGLSEILKLSNETEEVKKIVSHIVTSTNDLDQVVKDLTIILGIQKMSTHVMREIRLDEVLHRVMNTLEQEINETDAQVSIHLTANTIVSLYAYVESILYNLISNALKYRHAERRPVIQITSSLVDDRVRVDIGDNGLGIDLEAHQGQMFSLYKRFHFHVEGKGLGLYLVKTQLSALRGKIEVSSVVDVGTNFSLYFPAD